MHSEDDCRCYLLVRVATDSTQGSFDENVDEPRIEESVSNRLAKDNPKLSSLAQVQMSDSQEHTFSVTDTFDRATLNAWLDKY